MQQDTLRKKEGFQGQKAVVIPRRILANQCARNSIISNLYITDIGYYPKARFHYRERPGGADQHILIYCHEGQGMARIRQKEYHIQAGDFLIVPINVPHLYAANETNPWTIYWAHFKGHTSASIVSLLQKQAGGYKGYLPFNGSSIALFNEMYHQLERGYSMDNMMYANMCLWHFLTTFIYNNKYDTSGKPANKDTTDMAIDFLSKRIDKAVTLEEIAAAVNLSASHFCALFKKKTGFSPIEYFNHLKVQKACQYLLFTTLRIKEIALEVGIEDQYYFSRMFTRIMGISPNSYREKRIH